MNSKVNSKQKSLSEALHELREKRAKKAQKKLDKKAKKAQKKAAEAASEKAEKTHKAAKAARKAIDQPLVSNSLTPALLAALSKGSTPDGSADWPDTDNTKNAESMEEAPAPNAGVTDVDPTAVDTREFSPVKNYFCDFIQSVGHMASTLGLEDAVSVRSVTEEGFVIQVGQCFPRSTFTQGFVSAVEQLVYFSFPDADVTDYPAEHLELSSRGISCVSVVWSNHFSSFSDSQTSSVLTVMASFPEAL